MNTIIEVLVFAQVISEHHLRSPGLVTIYNESIFLFLELVKRIKTRSWFANDAEFIANVIPVKCVYIYMNLSHLLLVQINDDYHTFQEQVNKQIHIRSQKRLLQVLQFYLSYRTSFSVYKNVFT